MKRDGKFWAISVGYHYVQWRQQGARRQAKLLNPRIERHRMAALADERVDLLLIGREICVKSRLHLNEIRLVPTKRQGCAVGYCHNPIDAKNLDLSDRNTAVPIKTLDQIVDDYNVKISAILYVFDIRRRVEILCLRPFPCEIPGFRLVKIRFPQIPKTTQRKVGKENCLRGLALVQQFSNFSQCSQMRKLRYISISIFDDNADFLKEQTPIDGGKLLRAL